MKINMTMLVVKSKTNHNYNSKITGKQFENDGVNIFFSLSP